MSKQVETREIRKMSAVEKEQFDKLYQYVKKEILLYDDSQKIPSSLVLRLKGLSFGKLVENKSQKDTAHYSYDIILITFKLNKVKITSALDTMNFNDETHKFNFICKIVADDLNNVYTRLKEKNISQEKVKKIEVDNLTYHGAEYKSKTKEIKNKRLDSLW